MPRRRADPADTNEVGHLQAAFRSLVETHGNLFDAITYDAGGFSRANADAVVAAGKHYGRAAVERDERVVVSSYDPKRLTPALWLRLVRSHWGVESTHHTLDTAFAEDDRPWIEADPHGMLAVLLPRRIAYTLLAPFRASRTDERRAVRWRALLTWVRGRARGRDRGSARRPSRVRRRHTPRSLGSYPRRATSQGPEASGGRDHRRPPRLPPASTSSRPPVRAPETRAGSAGPTIRASAFRLSGACQTPTVIYAQS